MSKRISGCGAVGSALPWGGRGRWFKSSHSDQVKNRLKPYVSRVLSGFSFGIFLLIFACFWRKWGQKWGQNNIKYLL